MSNTNSILFKQLHKEFDDMEYINELREKLLLHRQRMLYPGPAFSEVLLFKDDVELLLNLIEDRYGIQ